MSVRFTRRASRGKRTHQLYDRCVASMPGRRTYGGRPVFIAQTAWMVLVENCASIQDHQAWARCWEIRQEQQPGQDARP